MRFYEKIAKRGMFCDKRVEHTFLKVFTAQVPNGLDQLSEKGEFKFWLSYYEKILNVDVSLYNDGIVRVNLYVESVNGELVEVGRLLVAEGNFFATVKHLINSRNNFN